MCCSQERCAAMYKWSVPVTMNVLHALFGLACLAVLIDTSGAKGLGAHYPWECILVLCIAHLISFVSGLRNFCKICGSSERTGLIWSDGVSLLGIWACVVYFDTNSEQKDELLNDYPNLWNMVFAEVILFFVMIFLSCCVNNNSKKTTAQPSGSSIRHSYGRNSNTHWSNV